MATSANDNATYHLAELNGTRIAILVARKQIKAFKKGHEPEPDPDPDLEVEEEDAYKDMELDEL